MNEARDLAAQAAAQATSSSSDDLTTLLVFGGSAIFLFTAVYVWRKTVTVTFGRLYGLLVVATLATALAFAQELASESRTAAFALLGTISGYLAGAKPTVIEGGQGSDGAGERGNVGAESSNDAVL